MRHQWLTIPLAALLLGVGPAFAQAEPDWRSWPMGHRVGANVGAFFANLNTKVRLDGADGSLGTGIDFEQDLGLDDTKTRPMVEAHWRFAKKHRLEFSYFNLDRSGDGSTTVNIKFGENTFQANLPLHAFFDVEVYNLGYSYSILFDEKKELAVGFALSIQDFAIGFEGTVLGQPLEVRESESVLAPLPTFTGRFSYAITPKWAVSTNIGYFTIELDAGGDELSGDIIAVNAGVAWRLQKRFHLGLLYQYFHVDVNTTGGRRQLILKYTYDGPVFYFGMSF